MKTCGPLSLLLFAGLPFFFQVIDLSLSFSNLPLVY